MSIGILGAGRMGQAIAAVIGTQDDLRLSGIWTRDPGQESNSGLSPDVASSDLDRVVLAADVLVDFSLPAATPGVMQAITRHRKPLVCGVSGLDGSQLASLEGAAAVVPIVYDRNMSVGIAVLDELVRLATGSLGPDFAVAIHETHHVHKKDAPSGTALKLGESIAAARGQQLGDVAWYEPQANCRPCSTGDIRFEVERRGEVPGEHSVCFKSAAEDLTFTHRVTTREVFALGAIRAARWVVGRPPGRYAMKDVLFGRTLR